MGNENSTRWRGYAKKRTVQETRRINAREAQHVEGVAITTTTMPSGAARRWCLCPSCGARVWYLYQAQGVQEWRCRSCAGLSYKSAQQRGTEAAFYAWLDQAKWREYADRHPAHEQLPTDAKAAYDERASMLDFEIKLRKLEENAAEWIMRDLKAEWKERNRSQGKRRQQT